MSATLMLHGLAFEDIDAAALHLPGGRADEAGCCSPPCCSPPAAAAGTDGKPVAPHTIPAPAPAPEPPPPTLQVVAQVVSRSSETGGYSEYDEILVHRGLRVSAEGQSRWTTRSLAIEIGEHARLARLAPPPGLSPEESRWIGSGSRTSSAPTIEDTDGISIAADAFDFSEGVLLNEDGVEIQVEIYAVTAAPRHGRTRSRWPPGRTLPRMR